MQIKYLHKNIYKVARLACKAESYSPEVVQKLKQLKNWELLKSKGCTDPEIARLVEISRPTYFRWKAIVKREGPAGLKEKPRRPKRKRQSARRKAIQPLIFAIRQANPNYGKLKITRILARDHHILISDSTVGRVLRKGFEEDRIRKYRAARKRRKRRTFKGHAKRWSPEQRAKFLGQMVQIDHMSVTKNQQSFKHFKAWDPISKIIVAECYSNASSRSASLFLDKVIQALPFKLLSVQVDGGSEFMKEFEKKCAENKLPLYVLPPKSPKLNGGVERGNRTFREDFYDQPLLANGISEMRQALNQAVKKYNTYRPHQALNGQTPFEYTQHLLEDSLQSHMI